MSDEYVETTEPVFSAFWPLLVLILCLVTWSGYQAFAANSQRSLDDQQFQNALPNINAANGVAKKYLDLMKDLVQTSQKDPAAAQIVKDAIQAGWIKVQNTNAPGTPTEPPK